MSVMIPNSIDADLTKSAAERHLFKRFQSEPGTDSWIVLHSLFLAKHIKQRFGEIDFVVITPDLGVYCLEVKGGRVQINAGTTSYMNRYGEISEKNGTPFAQANNGMFSVREIIRERAPELDDIYISYGVMFPDIVFAGYGGPDAEQWRVYDNRDNNSPLRNYFLRMAKNVYAGGRYHLSADRMKMLRNTLRPDFVAPVVTRDTVNSTEFRLGQYTEEQFEALDAVEDNRRVLFLGGAGTGKTVIALELARRAASDGKRVLFLCLTPLLGSDLKNRISRFGTDISENITADDINHFMSVLIGRNFNALSGEELFPASDELALLAADSFSGGNNTRYDILILDEAQDILKENMILLFDEVLLGGLKDGCYAFFADFANQAVFDETVTFEKTKNILSEASMPVIRRLNRNCRNTRRISTAVSLFSGLKDPPRESGIEGEPVKFMFYSDKEDQRKKLEERILFFRQSGVDAGRITVLTCLSDCRDSFLYSLNELGGNKILFLDSNPEPVRGRGGISVSTVRNYKGLENSIILITDIEQIDTEYSRKILYTGMSRSRLFLDIFINQKIKSEFQRKLSDLIEMP